MCRVAAGCLASVAAVGFASNASAGNAALQDPPTGNEPPDAEVANIGEIVVTAQRRSQAINDVGMSITAVTGEQLSDLGIRGPDDLGRVEPSFKFSSSSYGTPVYTLRGIGFNDTSLAASPTVSVYTDEIPYAYSVLSRGASLDNERVEILKGPQGTLFGQNATAGAVNYIAAKPTANFASGLEVTAGRFDYLNLNGFVSGRITDTLLGRVAVDMSTGGGWQHPYTREDRDLLGDQELYKGRILLDWQPNDTVNVRFGASGWTDKSETTVPQLRGIVLNRPSAAASVPGVVNYLLAPSDIRSGDWNADFRPRNDQTFFQTYLKAQFALGDSIDLISLTSYDKFDGDDLRSNDGTTLYVNKARVVGESENFFQELRLQGVAVDGRLNWVAGAQYSSSDVSEQFIRTFSEGSPAYSASPAIIGVNQVSFDNSTTKAAFGNLNYDLTESLTLNAGLRYTRFELDHAGCSQDRSGSLAALIGWVIGQTLVKDQCLTILPDRTAGKLYENGVDEDNVSWRLQVDWKITPDSLIYSSISQGYKAGTVPNIAATTYVSQSPVSQESVLAYEVGAKLGLFDNRVQLNGAVFYYDYTDKQLFGRSTDPLGIFGTLARLINIPESRVAGAEVSVVARPIEGLTLNAALSYLDTEVTGTFLNYNAYGSLIDFQGLSFPYTPKWSGTAGVEYRWWKDALGEFFIGGDVAFQSSSVSAFGGEDPLAIGVPGYIKGDPSFNIDGYAYFNARFGIDLTEQWTVQVYGKNIFNERYVTDVTYMNDSVGERLGAPATYGLTVRWRH